MSSRALDSLLAHRIVPRVSHMLVIVNCRSQILDRISVLYDDEQAFLQRKVRDANIEMS